MSGALECTGGIVLAFVLTRMPALQHQWSKVLVGTDSQHLDCKVRDGRKSLVGSRMRSADADAVHAIARAVHAISNGARTRQSSHKVRASRCARAENEDRPCCATTQRCSNPQ